MVCSACGNENKPGARFCAACGKSLTLVCRDCGATLKPGARFCPQCGRSVDTAAASEIQVVAGATPAATPVAPATLAAKSAAEPAQYSADGKWGWDGTQWIPVSSPATMESPPPAAAASTSGPPASAVGSVTESGRAKRRNSPLKYVLLGLFVAAVLVVGLVLVSKLTASPITGTGIGKGPYYLHYNCKGDTICMSSLSSVGNEATTNGGNTGIFLDYSGLANCKQGVANEAGLGESWWCSTSTNPSDTGP